MYAAVSVVLALNVTRLLVVGSLVGSEGGVDSAASAAAAEGGTKAPSAFWTAAVREVPGHAQRRASPHRGYGMMAPNAMFAGWSRERWNGLQIDQLAERGSSPPATASLRRYGQLASLRGIRGGDRLSSP